MNVRKHLDVEKHFLRTSSSTFNETKQTKLSVYEPYVKKKGCQYIQGCKK